MLVKIRHNLENEVDSFWGYCSTFWTAFPNLAAIMYLFLKITNNNKYSSNAACSSIHKDQWI